MSTVSRRAFIAGSVGALSTLSSIANAQISAKCSDPILQAAVVPSRVVVDCATKRNFQLFRANPDYVDLTGVVSLNFVQGKLGGYPAGSMMLFPRLKPKGIALGLGKVWPTYVSTGNDQMAQAAPIRMLTLPPDDYFCRFVLKAPWTFFIGFSVDVPFEGLSPNRTWLSNVDKLADGQGVGVGWASANLNAPWFAGSRWIPNDDKCQGLAWRKAIIDGLSQASVGTC